MSILSLGQIVGNQRSAYQVSEKARTAIADISKAADTSVVNTADQDSSSAASRRSQAKITSFRDAARGAAKNLAEVSFALRGTEAMAGQLTELQSLAKKALENPLDEKSLERLNKSIKSARGNLDQIAQKNQFSPVATPTGQKTTSDEESQSILPKLNGEILLGKEAPITSESDLRSFITTVQNAASQISALNEDVQELMDNYETTAIHFEISLQNQLAANSTLPKQSETSLIDALFGNAGQALYAQGNRLSPEIMNLI